MRVVAKPGGLFQSLSRLPGGSSKHILGSAVPWLGASVLEASARLRVSSQSSLPSLGQRT